MLNQKNVLNFKTLLLSLSIITTLLLVSCVESITDTTKSSSITPTIDIYSPATNDSVMIGKTPIYYQAADGAGGTGLSHIELYVNKLYQGKFSLDSDGNNPEIYLQLDPTLLGTKINYYLIVYNKTDKLKQSKTQENIYIKDKIPTAPSDLLLGRISDYEITIRWNDNSGNEEGFELWRKDVGSAGIIDYRRIKTLALNTISFRESGLSPFVDYFYKVRAFNKSGYSAFSNESGSNSVPGGPWNLTAEAVGSSLVHLRWVDFAVNEQGFQIERKSAYETAYKVIAITAPNATDYYDKGVQSSGTYTYRVAYFTQTSVSSYSNDVTISTFSSEVSAPSGLKASYTTTGGLKLEWVDNSKSLAIGTVIERSTTTSSQFIEIGSVEKDILTYSDRTAKSGTVYYYRVRQKLDKNIYTPYSDMIRVDIPVF